MRKLLLNRFSNPNYGWGLMPNFLQRLDVNCQKWMSKDFLFCTKEKILKCPEQFFVNLSGSLAAVPPKQEGRGEMGRSDGRTRLGVEAAVTLNLHKAQVVVHTAYEVVSQTSFHISKLQTAAQCFGCGLVLGKTQTC